MVPAPLPVNVTVSNFLMVVVAGVTVIVGLGNTDVTIGGVEVTVQGPKVVLTVQLPAVVTR